MAKSEQFLANSGLEFLDTVYTSRELSKMPLQALKTLGGDTRRPCFAVVLPYSKC